MAKKGTKYKCGECGAVVVVEEECGCALCDLICCGEAMKEVKPKAKKKSSTGESRIVITQLFSLSEH